MGGHDRGSETLQTAWSNNRIDNPYELFIHDLLCDVTLTVSSGETSNQSGRDTIYDETETKENVAQIETSHKSLSHEKRSSRIPVFLRRLMWFRVRLDKDGMGISQF